MGDIIQWTVTAVSWRRAMRYVWLKRVLYLWNGVFTSGLRDDLGGARHDLKEKDCCLDCWTLIVSQAVGEGFPIGARVRMDM